MRKFPLKKKSSQKFVILLIINVCKIIYKLHFSRAQLANCCMIVFININIVLEIEEEKLCTYTFRSIDDTNMSHRSRIRPFFFKQAVNLCTPYFSVYGLLPTTLTLHSIIPIPTLSTILDASKKVQCWI